MRKSRLTLDGASLTLDQLRQFERERPAVELADAARARMRESEATVVATVESGRTAYGSNTGFGAFANRVIPAPVGKIVGGGSLGGAASAGRRYSGAGRGAFSVGV